METIVTAVIPTVGRPELSRAIDSVRKQSVRDVNIIVVADMVEDDPRAAQVREVSNGARLIFTGGGARGARARNLGVQATTTPWVAFLDDDDFWLPRKIETQLAAAASIGATVISSRVNQVAAADLTPISTAVPTKVLTSHDDPAVYLFRRRHPGAGRASIFTSTLMVTTELAKRIPWDPDLPRHQDWDWILRLSSDDQFRATQCEEPLVGYVVGSMGSISASADWETSLTWAARVLHQRDKRIFVDFVAAQSLRYALQARSAAGVCACLLAIAKARRIPSGGPIIIGAAGALSRRGIVRAMKVLK